MVTCQSCGNGVIPVLGGRCPLCRSWVAPDVAHAPAVQPEAGVPADAAAIPGPGGEAVQVAEAGVVEGTVIQSYGPTPVEGRRDWWRIGAVLLLTAALLPVFVGVWMALFAVRLTLGLAGVRFAGGRGLLGEIIAFHVVGNVLHTPDPVSVYEYVVDTGAGVVQARQEGEFTNGRIFVGNRVRLRGTRRGGALVIVGGFNDTLGTRLDFRASAWRSACLVLLLVVGGWFATWIALASASAVAR